MNVKEAAEIIDCNPVYVSYLCRQGQGKRKPGYYLRAKKIKIQPKTLGYNARLGYRWDISEEEVDRFISMPVSGQGARGQGREPKGRKRKDRTGRKDKTGQK